MADEQQSAQQSAPAQSAQTFIVQGTLRMDGVIYAHGSEITLSDPTRIAELREAHAIATPFEVTPPEQLQAQHEQIVTENEDLRSRLAELEAQLAAQDQAAAAAAAAKSGSKSQG